MYLIVGGGDVSMQRLETYLNAAELIIAADRGADRIIALGRMPDVFLGDMDSVTILTREHCKAFANCEVVEYNSEKDQTDGELALVYAFTHGAKEIIFCGSLGDRIDHTLSNIFCSSELAKKGIKIMLEDDHQEIFFVVDDLTHSGWKSGETVSILSLEEKSHIEKVDGFKYSLVQKDLKRGTSLGISNEVNAPGISVRVTSGLALVIRQFNREDAC